MTLSHDVITMNVVPVLLLLLLWMSRLTLSSGVSGPFDDQQCLCADGTGQGLGQVQPDIEIFGEAPDKMTYTEQANKRTNCKRLTWYLSIFSLSKISQFEQASSDCNNFQ